MKFFTLLFTSLLALGLQAQVVPIYDIQGQSSASPYDGYEITTKGIVTAAFAGSYFIQDGDSAWCGMYIYDNTYTPQPGDSVQLTATVEEYYNMTEMTNVSSYQVINTGNPVPEPVVITTGEATEAYESVFIRVEDATCTNPDLGYGEWELNDGSGAVAVDDMGYPYTPTQGLNYNVQGPLNYSYSAFKIEPRNENDVQVSEALFINGPVSISDIQETSVTFSWETNAVSNTVLAYGETNALELDTIVVDESVTAHTITLDGLSANTIYYVKPYSIAGEDTTLSSVHLAPTKSTSSGAMKVYFNHSIDSTEAWENYAVAIPNAFTDTIISYIDKAQQTLDITMYDLVDTTDGEVIRIINAINDAYDRGVTVRYITDDEPANPLLDSLNPSIPLLRGNAEAIMHDKFIIIDAQSIDSSWVMTGSTNHTIANLDKDYNNIICIQDHQLAKGYLMEFNEMWGSEGAAPDEGAALFGADKTDNTPHHYNIGGIYVESYFSPSDGTTSKIVEKIDAAQSSVEFGMLVFTENTLGTAIKNAHDRGLDVRGIIDYTGFSGDEYDFLVSEGVNVLAYENEDGSEWPEGATLHHKYAVLDQATENAVLITGSHNWSASAESINDENTLIIHDRNMANLYHQEFAKRFQELEDLLNIDDVVENSMFRLYPNPSENVLHVDMHDFGNAQYRIVNIQGRVVMSGQINANHVAIRHNLPSGLYVLTIESDSQAVQNKFIVR
ncbi:Phospholipase D precursor [Salinivirga cyanobacteriivorans]|uniref:phospholipase D n=1 Tax=Salinivirga cyanobacteriivorans TaxID=1307839 RepID=A0A0S2I0P5_9BACT|nr:phospholipase D-like domain-containing protein [Salinivirga cyanobacteriivorans]ALO15853.1 Phospholipase D precursor [Salinivirga cyanobacteriivorans]